MKKITKILLVVCLCVCTCFGFVACDKTKLSATTNTTDGVISNGGSVLQYNGYVYFLNGSSEFDSSNTNNVVHGAIYKAKCDEFGNVLVDSDGKPSDLERVVSSLAGFDKGSLHIFGNFLYYTTPNTGKNNKGTVLSSQTSFCRYDLVNGTTQKIFTTALNSSDEISYAYYKMGAGLYLMCYEKTNATLTSVKIGNKCVAKVIANDVKSVVFGENYGEAKLAASNSVAEKYIYYTLGADDNSAIRTGVRAYKILPDGTGKDKISEGESITLLSVRNDKLIYSFDSKIYAKKITSGDDLLTFELQEIISEVSYDNIVFVEEDDGEISILAYDDTMVRFIKVVNGVVDIEGENNYSVCRFEKTDSTFAFIETAGDYVIYSVSNILYKVKYKNLNPTDIIFPDKLSTTTCNAANGLLTADVLGDYIYYFYTNNNLTYLYRASLDTLDAEGNRVEVVAATKFAA